MSGNLFSLEVFVVVSKVFFVLTAGGETGYDGCRQSDAVVQSLQGNTKAGLTDMKREGSCI